MKSHCYLQTIAVFASLLLLPFSVSAQQSKSVAPQPAIYQQKMQSGALLFIENKGQIADDKGNRQPDILFTASSGGAKIYLTATGIHYQFSKTDYPEGYDPFSEGPGKKSQQEDALRKQIKNSTHRFTVELQGANPHPVVSKQGKSSYYENYYLPQCPNGITGAHGYEKILFKNVYPNIDWVVYSKGGYLEYDFLVHPGGNPASIILKIKDADAVGITPQGELLMQTGLGEVKEKAPVSYVDDRIIPSRFKQNSDGTIGFVVQAQPGKELLIDPSIVWSTYYGGNDYDKGNSCRLDKNGYLYLAGLTASTAGIASGGFQTVYNGGFTAFNYTDAFLVKFDTSGNRIWATYYGGTGSDDASGCAVDDAGNIYITGQTSSSSSMASGGFQNNYGGGGNDGFLAKFDPAGNRIWASYYGGNSEDAGVSCMLDNSNNLYISGFTKSSSAIAASGFQNTFAGNQDVFLAKFNSSGNRLWATYYGGSEFENLLFDRSCSVDRNGNIYLAGYTQTTSGLASGGFQNNYGGGYVDAFLVKFNSNGSRLWATYYGGQYDDFGSSCTTDTAGNVYLSGMASPGGNLTENGFQNFHGGGYDGFLVKFNPAGNRLWGTYYGGIKNDFARVCTVDTLNNIYVAGTTTSSNAIASNGFQNSFSDTVDAFIVKFTNSGTRLWASYYGGIGEEFETSCDTKNGNVYLAGYTTSRSGIFYNGFQNAYGGGFNDAYLLKIGDITCLTATQPSITTSPDTICIGSAATLALASGSLNSATTWQWRKDSCNGAAVGTGTSISVGPTATTTYYVRGEGGCAALGSCISKTIVVNPATTASVTLTANPAGPVIAGTMITFTATPVNGGTAPLYSFRVNTITVQSGSSNTYATNSLVNGDVVEVLLRSNMACVTNTQVVSPPVTMTILAPCIPPTVPVISASYDTVCTGATSTLTVASGALNSATHWQWYSGSCGSTPIGNTGSITVTPPATTTYYIRGEGGCIAAGNCSSKTIYVKPKPVVSFTALPASLCSGDTLAVTFTGIAPATAAYQWNWGGGNVVNGTGAGPYKVVYNTADSIGLMVDNGACRVSANRQSISVTPRPTINFNLSDTIGCGPLSISFFNTSNNANSWNWLLGDNTSSGDAVPPPHFYPVGVYAISLTATNGSCSRTATRTLRVLNKPTARFSSTPGINTTVPLSQATFYFSNTSQNASSYQWLFGDGISSAAINPSHQYLQPGHYTIQLFAYNALRCADSSKLNSVFIIADTVTNFNIPNAFSPNDDGVNDTWIITKLQQYPNCRVTVYNRWGQPVFTSVGYNRPWDGKYNNKQLPIDTYYYAITLEKKSYTGSVTLVR